MKGKKPHARKQEAVDRYAAGERTRLIAADLGVSHRTVQDWVRRAGVPRRSVGSGLNTHYRPTYVVSVEVREAALERVRNGEPMKHVALDVGVHWQTVRNWRKREIEVALAAASIENARPLSGDDVALAEKRIDEMVAKTRTPKERFALKRVRAALRTLRIDGFVRLAVTYGQVAVIALLVLLGGCEMTDHPDRRVADDARECVAACATGGMIVRAWSPHGGHCMCAPECRP